MSSGVVGREKVSELGGGDDKIGSDRLECTWVGQYRIR